MTDREYEELEKRIEERKRIKAMVADMEESKKECKSNRFSECARDKTPIEKIYGGRVSKKNKIAGDSFDAIQIRNGD